MAEDQEMAPAPEEEEADGRRQKDEAWQLIEEGEEEAAHEADEPAEPADKPPAEEARDPEDAIDAATTMDAKAADAAAPAEDVEAEEASAADEEQDEGFVCLAHEAEPADAKEMAPLEEEEEEAEEAQEADEEQSRKADGQDAEEEPEFHSPEEEPVEEEEPQNDEQELPPWPDNSQGDAAGMETQDDTLQLLLDVRHLSCFGESSQASVQSAVSGGVGALPPSGEPDADKGVPAPVPSVDSPKAAESGQDSASLGRIDELTRPRGDTQTSSSCSSSLLVASGDLCSPNPAGLLAEPAAQADAKQSDAAEGEDVGLQVIQEAVRWLLERLYRYFCPGKLDKVPDMMTYSQTREVSLLREALWKYVDGPSTDAKDAGLVRSAKEQVKLLQEWLQGLADHFEIEPVMGVLDEAAPVPSFLVELYQMLSQMEIQQQLAASSPQRPEMASSPQEAFEKTPELLNCRRRWREAYVRRVRRRYDPDEPASQAPPPPQAPREDGWQLEKQPIEMFE